jgi:hypothetical protein
MNRISQGLASAFVATLIAGTSALALARPVPPPRNFRHDHYAYREFERFLAERASRAKVHRKLTKVSRQVYEIDGKAQFLALPHGVPPSERALILLEHWPTRSTQVSSMTCECLHVLIRAAASLLMSYTDRLFCSHPNRLTMRWSERQTAVR